MKYMNKTNAKKLVDSWYNKWVGECSNKARNERVCNKCEFFCFQRFVTEENNIVYISDCEMLETIFRGDDQE